MSEGKKLNIEGILGGIAAIITAIGGIYAVHATRSGSGSLSTAEESSSAPQQEAIVQANEPRLEFNNNTDDSINGLYAVPEGSAEWEENLLGSDPILPGQTIELDLSGGDVVCVWDILIEFSDGAQEEDLGVDVCEISSYEIK